MSTKINYVVKTPSRENGIFTVFKVEEKNGQIKSKELFFTGSRDRVVRVLLGLIDDQLQRHGSISGRLINIKSELLQQIPECFDEKTGRQEFLNFDGSFDI